MESLSCFQLEDYFLGLHDDQMDPFFTEPRMNQKSQSLFREPDDHNHDNYQAGLLSPTDSTTSNKDGLPISDDSWTLLQEFEDFSSEHRAGTAAITTLFPNYDLSHDLGLQDISDALECPGLPQLDLLLAEHELASEAEAVLSPSNSVPVAPDPTKALESKPVEDTSTSDLLAKLISQTFSLDASLEGFLSSTTLDINAVFGHATKTSDNLVSNESSSVAPSSVSSISDESLMDLETQETAEIKPSRSCVQVNDQKTENNKRSAVRSKSKKSLEERYLEMRNKNNEASRRSRMLRKQKRQSLSQQAIQLEEDNKNLRHKAEELEKAVRTLKDAFTIHLRGLVHK